MTPAHEKSTIATAPTRSRLDFRAMLLIVVPLAVAAALALVCYGEFRRDAMKIMTDVPALVFALWACVLYLRLRRGEGRSMSWALAGMSCAAAFALRLEMLALCVPFGLFLLQDRL